MTPTSVEWKRQLKNCFQAQNAKLTQAECLARAVCDEASVVTNVEDGYDPMHDGRPAAQRYVRLTAGV